jgi:hypothetical protein
MKCFAVLLLFVAAASAQTSWRYVSPKSSRIVAMEWRKVLGSPDSARLRRELPPDAAAALGAINIIEGIDRLLLASDDSGTLIVLEGNFDRNALKGSAASEGAIVKPYKAVEIIAPAEAAEDDVVMGLVSAKHILLGYEATLTRAIDRAETNRGVNRAAGYDLWVLTPEKEKGWRIGETEPAAAPPDEPGGKIRIYGLDEGVREIDLVKPKQ